MAPEGSPTIGEVEPLPRATPAGRRTRGSGQLGDRVQSLRLSRLPERHSTLASKLAWMAAIVVVCVGSWFIYTTYYHATTAELESRPAVRGDVQESNLPSAMTGSPAAAAPRPTLPAPAPNQGEVVLEAKGYIVPAQQILVSPKVSGMIISLNVEEGRRVQKGDVLAVLEATDYETDLQRSKASVRLARERLRELENGNRPEEIQRAEAELREAEAQLAQLEADHQRNETLRKRDSITQQDFELSQSLYLAQQQRVRALESSLALLRLGPREERIEMARAELAQSEAQLAKDEWRLGNCTIRAPISGTILRKNAEEGNIVNPIAFNGSFSLCEMADLANLEAELNIQERDVAVVEVGQKCRVRAEAYPDRLYEGHVDRLMPIADRAKGAIPVRVKIYVPPDEEGLYLKPEMGAIVTFLADKVEPQPALADTPPLADEIPVATQ